MAKFDVFMLDGDSNSGLGYVSGTTGDAVQAISGPQIYGWNPTNSTIKANGNDPQNFTGSGGTVPNSIGLAFAKLWRDQGHLRFDRNVLLVPTAHFGTGFSSGHWQPGGAQHESAVAMVNAAMAAAGHEMVMQGMVFNGGANDGNYGTAYTPAFKTKIADYRARITGFARAPIVIGNFLPDWRDQSFGARSVVFDQIKAMPASFAAAPNAAVLGPIAYADSEFPTRLTSPNGLAGIHYGSDQMALYAVRQLAAFLTLKRTLSLTLAV
jgi:hypothetical protein